MPDGATPAVAVPGVAESDAAVPVLPGDTVESLHERIKAVERHLYPETIRLFSEGALPT